jgi:large subunit ribosomal protein L19
MNRIKKLEAAQFQSGKTEFRVGDQVRVWTKIEEQDRIRLTPFEGLVIRRRGNGLGETFTVRRVTHGEGVERNFPTHTPVIDHVDVLRRGKVKRSRLYYLRSKVGKTKISAADPTGPLGGTAKPDQGASTEKPNGAQAPAAADAPQAPAASA